MKEKPSPSFARHLAAIEAGTITRTNVIGIRKLLNGAPRRAAAILDAPQYLVAGERLWNGAEVTASLAAAYNRLTDKIEQFKANGRRVPEELLNGRHNLIASA